jgi:hypothetical protein
MTPSAVDDHGTFTTLFRLFRLLRLQKFVGIIEIWEYSTQLKGKKYARKLHRIAIHTERR